mmetsp:Transcript_3567/g.6745  ORF Transcript_3567/g.6745 Transcript_3567/m.6745 type:complete len:258 (+) Transcript_3567:295-1068(+)
MCYKVCVEVAVLALLTRDTLSWLWQGPLQEASCWCNCRHSKDKWHDNDRSQSLEKALYATVAHKFLVAHVATVWEALQSEAAIHNFHVMAGHEERTGPAAKGRVVSQANCVTEGHCRLLIFVVEQIWRHHHLDEALVGANGVHSIQRTTTSATAHWAAKVRERVDLATVTREHCLAHHQRTKIRRDGIKTARWYDLGTSTLSFSTMCVDHLADPASFTSKVHVMRSRGGARSHELASVLQVWSYGGQHYLGAGYHSI